MHVCRVQTRINLLDPFVLPRFSTKLSDPGGLCKLCLKHNYYNFNYKFLLYVLKSDFGEKWTDLFIYVIIAYALVDSHEWKPSGTWLHNDFTSTIG